MAENGGGAPKTGRPSLSRRKPLHKRSMAPGTARRERKRGATGRGAKRRVRSSTMFLQKNLNQTLDTRLETGKINDTGCEKSLPRLTERIIHSDCELSASYFILPKPFRAASSLFRPRRFASRERRGFFVFRRHAVA